MTLNTGASYADILHGCSRQRKEHVRTPEMGACLACLRNGKKHGDGGQCQRCRSGGVGMTLEAMLRPLILFCVRWDVMGRL